MDRLGIEMTLAEAYTEKREARRRRVLKGGIIHFNNGYGSFDCKIKNMTDEGAMLEMPDTSGIPSSFSIKMGDDRLTPVTVVWRTAANIGVRFAA